MVEIQVNGVTRGFRFGTQTLRVIREVTGIETIEEIFEGLMNNSKNQGVDKVRVRSQIDHIFFINDFLFSCAKDYARVNKQDSNFTKEDVSDWLDTIGLAEAMNVVGKLIKGYTEKNAKAPDTTGLSVQTSGQQ